MVYWPVAQALLFAVPALADVRPQSGAVAVEIIEGVPDKKSWDLPMVLQPVERFNQPAFGFVGLPKKFSDKGAVLDRTNPLLIRATGEVALAAGEYRFLLRSRGAARLFIDGKVVLQNEFLKANANGHEEVPELPTAKENGLYVPQVGQQDKLTTLRLDGGKHEFKLEAFAGGQKVRLELGDLCVGVARGNQPFQLLGATTLFLPLSDEGWAGYSALCRGRLQVQDNATRKAAAAKEDEYWHKRHEIASREVASKPVPAVPEVPRKMPVHNAIDQFIGRRLEDRKATPAPLCDDWTFLRRVTLDTVGVVPTREEIEAFLNDTRSDRRARVIDRLLADPRWADHWVGYWQDVLAENPGILKPTLNNTGPFRWWLHQAFLDNLAMDRFASELVMMEGSRMEGAPGGFAMATENDAPMAAKAHILSKAFLGIEMQCARCHDAPYHPYEQKDLFSMAAMLGKGPIMLPATSVAKFPEGGRKPIVSVSLKPGQKIDPAWPFDNLGATELPAGVLRDPKNPRERLAAILTSPGNERFPQVIVNRLWKRYLGWGLVEPVDDWKNAQPSHPELLKFLAHELVAHDYDLKHVARLILNSHTYQREVRAEASKLVAAEDRLFASAVRRRLSAEQLVDSLFHVAGKEFHSEPLTFDPEGRRPITEMMNLGKPRRAWEFTSLSNERDRPALALPVAQSIVDVMTAFGWRDSRQFPLTVREEAPNPLQPLILANGTVGSRISRLSDDSAFTDLCLEDQPLPELIRKVFLQVLSRKPTDAELQAFTELLKDGYDARRVPGFERMAKKTQKRMTTVSWANHLSAEATKIKLELERLARAGDPPTERLQRDWRERMEDILWSLVNSPEFMFVP